MSDFNAIAKQFTGKSQVSPHSLREMAAVYGLFVSMD
jgi:hypothetical protein